MWIFLMIAFVLVMAGAFTMGKAGARYKDKYPCAVKIFLMGYVVFAGCFVFLVLSPVSPLDFSKIYLLVVSYGVIGLGFAGVYGAKKRKMGLPSVGDPDDRRAALQVSAGVRRGIQYLQFYGRQCPDIHLYHACLLLCWHIITLQSI